MTAEDQAAPADPATEPGVARADQVRRAQTPDELVARWWNGQRDRRARRDIWLTSDGQVWHVRARHGTGDEVGYDFTREYEARAMVDRLIAAAPAGGWKDITKLVRRPSPPDVGAAEAAEEEH